MNKSKILIFSITLALLSSCGFLDHNFNDQMTIQEVFSKRPTTERYLSGIYGQIPEEIFAYDQTFVPCADDAYFSWEKMDYELVNSGSYNESTVGVRGEWTPKFNPWNKYYIAINQATVFMDNVEKCPELTHEEQAQMKAEARFLRAYFYFNLFKQYGPIFLWFDTTPDMKIKAEDIDRHTVDECVDFIESEMLKASEDLPNEVADPTTWKGRITKGAALGMRSRVLLFAARPLFNGGGKEGYGKDLVNYYGKHIFPQKEDPSKWDKAAKAAKAVIDLNQYALHETKEMISDPVEKGMHSYREVFTEKWNEELIFARYYPSGEVWNQRVVPPRVFGVGLGGFGATLKLVDAYPMATSGKYPISGYKSNGAPIVDATSGYEEDGFTDGWYHPTHKDKPIKVHNSMKGRDGRFYASIFFNGMYWIHKDATKPEYKPVTFFTGGTSAFAHESGDYVKTGFLFTKYTDPTIDTRKNVWGSFTWCYMRLAEIYLNYAEACNEKPERDAEEALKYLNKLRKRAGINVKIETAYPQALTDREVLRDIIRRERMVELAYEGLRYYDLRTWMIADKEANGARYGLDLTARDYESSWERTSKICLPIVFETKHYLFPIGQKQLNEMKNFTQNQGW